MKIGNLILDGCVISAPLAGVSNRPFRRLAREGGAALTFTEMISSEAIIRHRPNTFAMTEFGKDEQPLGVQLFGADPEVIGQAAIIIIERFKPDLIDLNFGCPVKKVVRKNGGAAVLKDLGLTEAIIRATVEASGDTPVSVKIRTGWDDQNSVFEQVGKIAERAGAAAITLHARSRSKGFSGEADWTSVRTLKEAIGITVIGNGNVITPQDARDMIDQTGCDGIMVGRGSLGDPSIFRRMQHFLDTGELIEPPSLAEKIEMAGRHAQMIVEYYGEPKGIFKARPHLGWYVKGFPNVKPLHSRLVQINALSEIKPIFDNYRQGLS